jgi:uncharacterized RDD family membrane protein YckC
MPHMTEAEPAGSNQPSPIPAVPVIALERAGFGVRLAASLIDGAIILPIYLMLTGAFHYALAAHALRSPRRADPVFLSIFIGNALVLAYSLLEVKYATTPGKMMLRLRIESQAAAPATTAQLLARYAMKHGARLCGLTDALMSLRHLKIFYAWAPLVVFRKQPMEFITLRTIGELLWLFVFVGFFFTLAKSRQSLYDRLSRTIVTGKPAALAKRGFEPLPAQAVLSPV